MSAWYRAIWKPTGAEEREASEEQQTAFSKILASELVLHAITTIVIDN